MRPYPGTTIEHNRHNVEATARMLSGTAGISQSAHASAYITINRQHFGAGNEHLTANNFGK
jgi:hypothetical protein